MVLSTTLLTKWGVSCVINRFCRASPFPVLCDYDTLRDWLWCSTLPSLPMTTCFILPSSNVRFPGFSLALTLQLQPFFFSQARYFPFQSPTHPPWHPFPQRHRRWRALLLLLEFTPWTFSCSIKDFISIDLQRPHISSAAKTNQCHMNQINPCNYSKELMILQCSS